MFDRVLNMPRILNMPAFSINRQPRTKIMPKTKNYPFPQLSVLFLGMRCKELEGNNIETGGRGFFLELGCVMQKNSVFAKIFCPGLLENFRDFVIILSKKVRKLQQSFVYLFLNIRNLIY